MNYYQIASNHNSFGSSTCITQGSFQNPSTLLDVIANTKATRLGVVDITGKMVSGRILIANNDIIAGCVVDRTGESGTGALCKLLLIPFGNYVFRQAVPQDEWELQQHLELSSNEVASFLSGPSSIGLATHSASILELSFAPDESSYCPENDYVQSLIDAVGVESVLQDRSETSTPRARLSASQEHSSDCQKIVEGFSQRQQPSEVDFRVREKRKVEKAEALVSKENGLRRSDLYMALLGFVFMMAFSLVSLTYSSGEATATLAASKPISASIAINQQSTEQSVNEKEPTRYSFPARGQYNSEAPPAKSNSVSHRVTFDSSDGNSANSSRYGQETAGNQVDDSRVVSFWVQEVKKNPNDPAAREQLAYTLLRINRPEVSVEQFQALMQLRTVKSEELIRYTNALSLYNQRALATQFLQQILSTDPNNTLIRDQLAQIESGARR